MDPDTIPDGNDCTTDDCDENFDPVYTPVTGIACDNDTGYCDDTSTCVPCKARAASCGGDVECCAGTCEGGSCECVLSGEVCGMPSTGTIGFGGGGGTTMECCTGTCPSPTTVDTFCP